MNNTLIDNLLNFIKKETNKHEMQEIIHTSMQPILDLFIQKLYPYIFLIIILLFFFILINLGIFILIIRNKIH